jgi:hypothetical protein
MQKYKHVFFNKCFYKLQEDRNLYGVFPVYSVVENDGSSHLVFIKNSNAQGMQKIQFSF